MAEINLFPGLGLPVDFSSPAIGLGGGPMFANGIGGRTPYFTGGQSPPTVGGSAPTGGGAPMNPAPTYQQVMGNPTAYAGTSFDPARYLTYPGSPYGPGNADQQPPMTNTGNGSIPGYGLNYWNVQNDPTGQNHNVYANYLSNVNDPIAQSVGQALTSNSTLREAALNWLRANVQPGASTANPNATDFRTFYRATLNNQFPNGTGTSGANTSNGVPTLFGGTTPTTPTTTTPTTGTEIPQEPLPLACRPPQRYIRQGIAQRLD